MGGADQARHDEKAAADAEEAGKEADREPVADERRQQLARRCAVEMNIGIAAISLAEKHRDADRDHDKTEKTEQQIAIDHLAEPRAEKGARDARAREDERAGPFDRLRPRMEEDAGKCVRGNRDGAGADGDMRRGDADDIDEKRHGEDRPARADKAEREPDQGAGGERQKIGGGELHDAGFTLRRGARGSTAST